MQKHTVSVSKEYIKKCLSHGAVPKPFELNAVDINEICEALLKDILEEAIKIPFDEMVLKLNIADSPEAMLLQAAEKQITTSFQLIQKRASEIRKAEGPLKFEEIKKKLSAELNEASKTIANELETEFKQRLAEIRHHRTEKNRIRIDIEHKIAQVDEIAPEQNEIQMTLNRKEDPLYSRDLVQHIIRLRLNDPHPLKSTYSTDVKQTPILNAEKNRVWIGLY